MTLDLGFEWANRVAVIAWLSLFLGVTAEGLPPRVAHAQRMARWALWVGGRCLPILLCAAYGLVLWRCLPDASGGFGSLADVQRLFESPGVLLAGWMHFLAFDLWLGRWQVDHLRVTLGPDTASRSAWVMRAGLYPCLGMTFLFGPIGLLLFLLLVGGYRLARRQYAAAW
ncbi:MAG: DUF4281 domain-containing protein [Burkholderiaceae bacterium]|jgi:hypothetical protein|nr:DUF4281 domain-containing protein [Burkholderiaceae bacterium]